MKKYYFIDLCAGIGGGRLGLEANGLKCLAHSEIDTDAEKTYSVFFGNGHNFGDVTKLNPEFIPDNCDLIIGGFPCQPFSTKGLREGFNDERGQVLFSIVNILKAKQPRAFILENVKGFVSHDKGETMKTTLTLFDEAGYDVSWKVFDSKNYGIPQHRERVYFVGIRKDIPHNPIDWNIPIAYKISLKECLDGLHGNPVDIYNESWQGYIHSPKNEGKFNETDLLSEDYLIVDRRNMDMRCYRNYTPTLLRGNHGLFYVYNKQLYKINGYQALLLQGFPREFIDKAKKANINPNKLLAQAGNAMTVNVVNLVCKALMQSIRKDSVERFSAIQQINDKSFTKAA